jgi:hypothetical protein
MFSLHRSTPFVQISEFPICRGLISSSRVGLEQQLVDVRAGTVQLCSLLRQRPKRLNPIAVRRKQTGQIQAHRWVGRLASRSHIGHADARQLPFDSNGGDGLPRFGGNSDGQSSVPPERSSKSAGSCWATSAESMPESPTSVRRSNHWIDNAFFGDRSPRPWPGCEISAALTPEGVNSRTIPCIVMGMREQLETIV